MFDLWKNRGKLDKNAYAQAVPYTKAMYYAELVDAWRVVPRSILGAYGIMVWVVLEWFMAMPDPTTQQAALVTTISGTVAAVIGLYQHTGRKWGPHGAMGQMGANTVPIMHMPSPMLGGGGRGGGRTYERGGSASPGANYGDE
jgi:hypothetical protein